MKAQGSLPSEDAALVLLFSLVGSREITLRRIDGGRKIVTVLSRHTAMAPIRTALPATLVVASLPRRPSTLPGADP